MHYSIRHDGVHLQFEIDEDRCTLHKIKVEPKLRNSGIGSKTLREFIATMFRKNVRSIGLVASPSGRNMTVNRLFNFYRSHGFDNPDDSHYFILENRSAV